MKNLSHVLDGFGTFRQMHEAVPGLSGVKSKPKEGSLVI